MEEGPARHWPECEHHVMDPVWFRRPQTGTRDRAEKAAHPVTVSPGPGPGRIRTDLSTSQVAQQSRTHLLVQETRGQSLGREDPLEEGMATRSSILAWRIPWTEEPGRLQSMGLQSVEHD